MAKTTLTKNIEYDLIEYLYAVKYELAIQECTLGFSQQYGIVDVLSYKGTSVSNGRGSPRTRDVTWKCYEIKVSKADFYSKHKTTFVGDYNYFVMPQELYNIVKQDIPANIGVLIYNENTRNLRRKFTNVKRASKCKTPLSESEFMHEFLVSIARDARRWMRYKYKTEV